MREEPTGGFESAAGSGRGRFPAVDGMRAIAALAVLVCHAGATTGYTARTSGGVYLARLDVGVPVFFVISGFLLYRPFVAAHVQGRRLGSPVRFWLRRGQRIFPAYWVALTFVPVLTGIRLARGATDVVVYYGLLQVYDPDRILGGLYQAWTLCTELAFYLVLPLFAVAVSAGRRTGRAQVRRELAGIALLYLGSVAFRVVLLAVHAGGYQFTWMPAWADVFALGMLLAVVSESRPRSRLVAAAGDRPGLCWLVALAAFIGVAHIGIPLGLAPLSTVERLLGQFLYGVVALALIAPIALGGHGRSLRWLTSRPLATVGLLSYSIYLWHVGAIERAIGLTGGDDAAASFWPVLLVALTLSMVLAAATYVAVERPAVRVTDAPDGQRSRPGSRRRRQGSGPSPGS